MNSWHQYDLNDHSFNRPGGPDTLPPPQGDFPQVVAQAMLPTGPPGWVADQRLAIHEPHFHSENGPSPAGFEAWPYDRLELHERSTTPVSTHSHPSYPRHSDIAVVGHGYGHPGPIGQQPGQPIQYMEHANWLRQAERSRTVSPHCLPSPGLKWGPFCPPPSVSLGEPVPPLQPFPGDTLEWPKPPQGHPYIGKVLPEAAFKTPPLQLTIIEPEWMLQPDPSTVLPTELTLSPMTQTVAPEPQYVPREVESPGLPDFPELPPEIQEDPPTEFDIQWEATMAVLQYAKDEGPDEILDNLHTE
ncbi:hypothetical protein F5Y11DRAFT_345925 [Daldinia sp. FL1419]|nr:hypothetical protein F5Y11DRAFT_345925 [Daldinia sp. FL1419]